MNFVIQSIFEGRSNPKRRSTGSPAARTRIEPLSFKLVSCFGYGFILSMSAMLKKTVLCSLRKDERGEFIRCYTLILVRMKRETRKTIVKLINDNDLFGHEVSYLECEWFVKSLLLAFL